MPDQSPEEAVSLHVPPHPSKAGGLRMAFVRANLHDTTPAIERAVEGCRDFVEDLAIFCWNRSGLKLPESEVRDGIRIERFGKTAPPRSLKILFRTLQFQWWVFWRLRSFAPDAVQSLDFESGWPAFLVRCLGRRRYIYDMRDPVALCYSLPWWLRTVVTTADAILLAFSNGYVIPSEWLRNCLGRWGRKRDRPVAVVRNTCHEWSGASLPSETRNSEPAVTARIAFVGYLDESRGASGLLALCESDAAEVELIVAGTCRSDVLRQRLERSGRVRLLGKIAREEAFRTMRDADLVSLLYDPSIPVNVLASPNKFFEAMMLGTPVLVSEGMQLAEIVKNEGLGYVVRYGDADSLRNVVLDVRRAGVRDAFRSRCRDYYQLECRLSEDVALYREFYRQVLGRAA